MSKTNSFVIKGVSDEWKDFSYQKRYLDALVKSCAGLFHFIESYRYSYIKLYFYSTCK
jgi:hypothetical protein